MNKTILVLLGCTLALVSCSSDKDESNEENISNNIVGTWDATELRINDDTASDDALFASGILEVLSREDCYIISLQFNEDLTAVATNAVNYIVPGADQTGIVVPCPTQSDSESSTYTYDGSVVTFLDGNGQEVEVQVSIQGSIMTVNAADLEILNFDESGELIFVKR